KAGSIPLELHWTNAAHALKSSQRPWAPHRKLGQGSIREYNIGGHVFLTGDCGSNGLKGCEEPLLSRPYSQIVGKLRNSRSGRSRRLLASLPGGRLILDGGDSPNAKTVVTTSTGRACRRIAEVAKHERATTFLRVRIPLHGLQLRELGSSSPIEYDPVNTKSRKWSCSIGQIEPASQPIPNKELTILKCVE